MLEQTHALLSGMRERIEAFIAPVAGNANARIILTGAGSSSYIGQCLEPLLDQRLAARAKAARLGDATAERIYAQAGSELAQIADALRRSLGFTDDEIVPLSYSGGAFSAGDLRLNPFKQSLPSAAPNFELRPPLHEPHYGAAMYAAKLFSSAYPA